MYSLRRRHHLGHVDLVVGGQHGGGVLAVFETARDGLAQAGHFHALLAAASIGGDGCARGAAGGGRGLRPRELQHVLFHHAAIAAGACDVVAAIRFRPSAFLARGVFDALAVAQPSGAAAGAGALRGRTCAGGHHGQFATCLDGAPSSARISLSVPAAGAGTSTLDLVGFKLAEHFVSANAVTDFLEPCGYGGFGDAFAQGRNHDID